MSEESRMSSRYHGYREGAREWLAKFREDPFEVVITLDDWRQTAVTAFYSIIDCEDCGDRSNLDAPAYFWDMTYTISLWCDVELRIDPAPLCELHRQIETWRPIRRLGADGKLITPSPRYTSTEIEETLGRALSTWERILSATLARGQPRCGSVPDGEPTRPAFSRDRLWLRWHEEENLGPAKIRDKWDSLPDERRRAYCPDWPARVGGETTAEKKRGYETVKKALRRARKERRD